jgi:hypothetical protein
MISVSDPTPRRLPTVAGTNKAPSAERDVPALAHDRPRGRNSDRQLRTMLVLKSITLCVLAAHGGCLLESVPINGGWVGR